MGTYFPRTKLNHFSSTSSLSLWLRWNSYRKFSNYSKKWIPQSAIFKFFVRSPVSIVAFSRQNTTDDVRTSIKRGQWLLYDTQTVRWKSFKVPTYQTIWTEKLWHSLAWWILSISFRDNILCLQYTVFLDYFPSTFLHSSVTSVLPPVHMNRGRWTVHTKQAGK